MIFQRILICTTGIVSIIGAISSLVLVVVRRLTEYQPPRLVVAILVYGFVVGFILQGVVWLIVGLSPRFWKT